jgi:hypothetical protein
MPSSPLVPPSSTIVLQDVVNWAKSFPEVVPVLGLSGFSQEPAITFANDVMQKILAQGMNWKWNRAYVPSFLTVALQQDYPTQITDVSWLETSRLIDINNSTNSGNMAPKPMFSMEVVRDLNLTSMQGNPFNLCFVPNYQATFGTWQPNYNVLCGYGQSMTPIQAIQSFVDANGNILYIDSTVMGLNLESPGFVNGPVTLPTPNPYGTTGSVQPILPPNTPAGVTILDGTVNWTVAPPNGYCLRVAPLPPLSGLCWLIWPIYQRKAKRITTLQQTISPIPDEYAYLFRSGFLAYCYDHAGSAKAAMQYAKWEEQIMTALKAGDREESDKIMFPSTGLTSGGGEYNAWINAGPSNPYSYGFGGY